MQEIFNKPKYFVRYPPGAAGHFFTLLLMSFVAPVQAKEIFSGHGKDNEVFVNQYHNFLSHYATVKTTAENYTDDTVNSEYINQWQHTYKFLPSPWPYYCVHTHLIRTDLWAQAWANAKLISITTQQHHQDQLAYNWMLKNQHKDFYSSYIEKHLSLVQWYFNIAPTIDLTDSRAQCWVIKHAYQPFWNQFNAWQINAETQVDFDQLFQGTLDLQELCEDLEIACDSNGVLRASELLQNYAKTQCPVPWQLHLEDYQ